MSEKRRLVGWDTTYSTKLEPQNTSPVDSLATSAE